MSTTPVYFAGIDIGSTASKTVVLKDGKIEDYFVLPTGWNGRETANAILEQLKIRGYADAMRCVATGYGRICVDCRQNCYGNHLPRQRWMGHF